MSKTLPRPIEPGDIRVGDRVQKSWSLCAADYTATFTVGSIEGGKPYSNDGVNPGLDAGATWTLLADAPEPVRLVGSHWRDPETGAEYVYRDDGDYSRYRAGSRRAGDACLVTGLDEEIARLQPLPVFDPATLWPHENNGRQCGADTGRWLCCRAANHDGLHAAYVSHAESVQPVYVWGRP